MLLLRESISAVAVSDSKTARGHAEHEPSLSVLGGWRSPGDAGSIPPGGCPESQGGVIWYMFEGIASHNEPSTISGNSRAPSEWADARDISEPAVDYEACLAVSYLEACTGGRSIRERTP